MRLVPDQDEKDLATVYRSLLAAECPTTVVRALREPGGERMSPALWKALVASGVLGLATPEEYGGSGGSLGDLAIFCVEAGRALCPMVVHSTLQASLAIDLLGADEQRAAWLPGLSDGSLIGTTALWSARDAAVLAPGLRAARGADGDWRVDGTADYVADADLADVIVGSASVNGERRTLGLVVSRRAPGVSLETLSVMGAHRLFRVRFEDVDVPASAILAGEDGTGLRERDLRRVANAAVALLSADLVGVAEAALARTVEHTLARQQFGRPIASFQAAQHLVADMHIAVSAARLAAHSAAFWIGRGRVATRETAIARMHAATAAKLVTLDAHQLHGGMGYVLETDLHLWSERARVLATLGGGADVAATWLEGEMGLDRLAPQPVPEGTWEETP